MIPHYALPRRARGLSLIELMIGLTIGMFILAGMTALFASSSQSRHELEKAARQIENGRFAIEMLREEIELAGFYGDYFPISSTLWTTPDPCTTVLDQMAFSAAATPPSVPTGIFGYEAGAAVTTNCSAIMPNRSTASDVLVVRRVSTTPVAATAALPGEHYLQVSNCADAPAEPAFVLGKLPANFVLHGVRPAGTPLSCHNGDISPVRKYVVRLFYIATCNDCAGAGDGVPTLKMAELIAGNSTCAANPADPCGSFSVTSLAEGIENLQFEYGLDTDGNGIPETYETAAAIAAGTNWHNVVGAKVFLLARNTEPTPGHVDTKTYILNSTGDPATGITPGGNFRRHAYSVTVRANNIAGRRQQ